MKASKLLTAILDSKKRYTVNWGGTRSGKTYNQLIAFIVKAYQSTDKPYVFSICSESMPHLRRGAMRDFFNILEENNLYNVKNHNKSEFYYKFGKSKIEFFGVEDSKKVHGATRDFLFINEAQNINYDTAFHLLQRTNEQIYLDFNPTHDFWAFNEILENEQKINDVNSIHSTIKDNPFISEHIVKDVYDRSKRDENYRNVYLLGKKGSLDGLIFKNWKIINSIPENFKLLGIGVDFGYNDPMTAIEVYRNENTLLFNELYYETEKITSDLIKFLQPYKNAVLYPDSAEKDRKIELQRSGFKVFDVNKGNINSGLSLMNSFDILVTINSVNLIRELRNYSWIKNKNGEIIDSAIDYFNHAIDAVRYVCISTLLKNNIRSQVKVWKHSR